jgi:hypothetical protein
MATAFGTMAGGASCCNEQRVGTNPIGRQVQPSLVMVVRAEEG